MSGAAVRPPQQLTPAQKEKEQLQKPAAVKMPPRKAHVARYTAALKRAARAEEESGPMRPRLVFDGGPSYVSRASLAELEPISAADMKLVPRRYEGASWLVPG